MPRSRYTDDQKAQALAIWRDQGPAEAARQTGISNGTIASWANRAGLQSLQPDKLRAAQEVKRLAWEVRRVELVHRMGEVAARALEVSAEQLDDGTPNRAKDAATTMAILVDKAQLLSGAATSRSETISTSQVDAEIHRLTEEMADVGAT